MDGLHGQKCFPKEPKRITGRDLSQESILPTEQDPEEGWWGQVLQGPVELLLGPSLKKRNIME